MMDGVVGGLLRNSMVEERCVAMTQDWLPAPQAAEGTDGNRQPPGGSWASDAWRAPYASAALANNWPDEMRAPASRPSSYPQWSGRQHGRMRLADLRKSPMTTGWCLPGDVPSDQSSCNTTETFPESGVSVDAAAASHNHATPTSYWHSEAVETSFWHGTTEPPEASCLQLEPTKHSLPGPRKLIGRPRDRRQVQC